MMMSVTCVGSWVRTADTNQIRKAIEFHSTDGNDRYVVETHAPCQDKSICRHVEVPAKHTIISNDFDNISNLSIDIRFPP